MTHSVKAICLKAVDYKDNDKMLLLFGAENGKFSALIRGVKKANAKLKFCAQPFCFGEYEIVEKGGRYTVANCLEIEGFSKISKDVDAYYCASVMLEFCVVATEDNQPNVNLFLALLNSLKRLTEISPKLILVKFLLEGLKYAGFGLSFDLCTACGNKTFSCLSLDLTDGGMVCQDCVGLSVYKLSPAETSCFKMIDETPYERLGVLKYDNRCDGMLRALAKYIETFLKKLNSIKFLF